MATCKGSPQHGRLYALGHCAQRTSGIIRRLCQHQYYHDIDQVNSTPSIIYNLCTRHNIPCPRLEAYVQNRDSQLDTLVTAYGVTTSQAKHAYQMLAYGGTVSRWAREHDVGASPTDPDFSLLQPFAQEMKQVRQRLMATPLGQVAHDKRRNIDKHNGLSVFSYLVFEEEKKALDAMQQFFEQQGYVVGALVFDGLQVERKQADDMEPLPDTVLRACEQVVENATGIRLALAEKPMAPTEHDSSNR